MSDSSSPKTDVRPGEPQQWQPPADAAVTTEPADEAPREYGGRKGLDPTRYGDWEKNGRCIDF